MAIPVPSIESWLPSTLDSVRTVSISEDDVTYYDFTLPSSPSAWTLEDALTEWASQATAHGSLSETYTWAFTGAGELRLAASGSYYLQLPGSLPAYLGFSAAAMGPATQFSPDTASGGWCACDVDYDAPAPLEHVRQERFRFTLPSLLHFAAGSGTTLTLTLEASEYESLAGGPLFVSKVRVRPQGFTSGAYSPTNPRGYLDVYLTEIVSAEPVGWNEDFWVVVCRGVIAE